MNVEIHQDCIENDLSCQDSYHALDFTPIVLTGSVKGKLLHMEVNLNFDCLTFSTKNKSIADFMTCIGCCQSEG